MERQEPAEGGRERVRGEEREMKKRVREGGGVGVPLGAATAIRTVWLTVFARGGKGKAGSRSQFTIKFTRRGGRGL